MMCTRTIATGPVGRSVSITGVVVHSSVASRAPCSASCEDHSTSCWQRLYELAQQPTVLKQPTSNRFKSNVQQRSAHAYLCCERCVCPWGASRCARHKLMG